MQCDGIAGLKSLARSKTVDPVLITIVTGVLYSVAAAVPWLETDERSILGRWRPDTHYRSIEGKAQPWALVSAMQSGPADLRILHHDGVDSIKCLLCERKKAILRDLQRIFCLSVHTSLSLDADTLKTLVPVE